MYYCPEEIELDLDDALADVDRLTEELADTHTLLRWTQKERDDVLAYAKRATQAATQRANAAKRMETALELNKRLNALGVGVSPKASRQTNETKPMGGK